MHGTGGHGRERLGTVRVANEVVARISALAALEVDGVHAMYHAGGSQQLDRILRRHAAHRGVKVELLDDDRLRLDVFVVMEAGTHLPVMGAACRAASPTPSTGCSGSPSPR